MEVLFWIGKSKNQDFFYDDLTKKKNNKTLFYMFFSLIASFDRYRHKSFIKIRFAKFQINWTIRKSTPTNSSYTGLYLRIKLQLKLV